MAQSATNDDEVKMEIQYNMKSFIPIFPEKQSYLPFLKKKNCFLHQDSDIDSLDDSDEDLSYDETPTLSQQKNATEDSSEKQSFDRVRTLSHDKSTANVGNEVEINKGYCFTLANLENSRLFTEVESDHDLSDADKKSTFLVEKLDYFCKKVNFPDEDEELFRKDIECSFYKCHPCYEMGNYSSDLNDLTLEKYIAAGKDGIKKYSYQHLLNCPDPLHFGCGNLDKSCHEDAESEEELENEKELENYEISDSVKELLLKFEHDVQVKKKKRIGK